MRKLAFTFSLLLLLTACASVPEKEEGTNEATNQAAKIKAIAEGDEALRKGLLGDALVKYLAAFDADPKDADVLYKVGTVHRLQRNYQVAAESYSSSLSLDSSHVGSREGLGLTYLKMENLQLARVMLERVVDEDPNRWQSLSALGVLNDLEEQYPAAQELYQQALLVRPNSVKVINNLGYSYYLAGNLEEAEKQFLRAVEMQPKFRQGWANLALVHSRRDEQELAHSALSKIGTTHQADNNLGYLNLLQDRPEVARQYFRSAIKDAPMYYTTAHENLNSVNTSNRALSTTVDIPIKNVSSSSTNGTGSATKSISSSVPTASISQSAPLMPAPTPAPAIKQAAPTTPSAPAATATLIKADTPAGSNTSATQEANVIPLRKLTRSDIYSVQRKLEELGYEPGDIDGVIGNDTLKAIRQFKSDKNFPVNNQITDQLLDALK